MKYRGRRIKSDNDRGVSGKYQSLRR